MLVLRQDPAEEVMSRQSGELSAWQIGVDRYLSTLSPAYKQAFRAPASANDCLRLLQEAQARNRKFDRLVTILQPLIEPLKRFEASIDVLVQTYSNVASPIWGPIRVVVTIVSTRLSTLHNVVVLLERLVEPLKRFHNYELLFRENIALRHAIGALYCDLIEFCTRVVVRQSKSAFHKSFGSFDKDVAEVSDKIRHHWAEIDVAANAANLLEAKEARAKEELQRALDFQRDVNRWLSPAVVEDDLIRLQALYVTGSCDWILESPEMQNFQDEKRSTSVRICGHPGGGKSVAASSLVKYFQAESKCAVLYFFCRATDAERSFTTSIIRTIIFQLLHTDPLLYATIAPIYNRSGRQVADSEVLVFELFDVVLKHTTHETIYILVDALDECHDTSTLISVFTAAQVATRTKIKLVVTSRDDPDLTEQLAFCNAHIALQTNPEPLARYIKGRVHDLSLPISKAEREQITAAVVAGSNGLWLFARLMLDELEKAASIGEIQQQVKTVPDGLAQLYTTILRNKEKQFTKTQMRIAQQIYLWLDASDYIPEQIWRARSTQGLDDDMINIIMKYASNSESEIFKPMELVLRLCAPLLTTRLLHEDNVYLFIDGVALHASAFVTEFFHQTAEQYLKWCLHTSALEVPASMKPRRLAELHRGACAIWYFTESTHFQHALHHLRERPRSEYQDCWLEMACGFWQSLSVNYLRRDLDEEEVIEAYGLSDNLTSFLDSDKCLEFVEASIILHYSGQCQLLAENVTASRPTSKNISWPNTQPKYLERLIESRDRFKADLAWCLTRFSASATLLDTNEWQELKPDGFDKRALARKMFALARRHRWLSLAPGACSINGFLLTGRT